MTASKTDNFGRPPRWGELKITRPRLPLDIAAQIDRIRDEFGDPETANQYIVDCLLLNPQLVQLRLFDCCIAATPGINSTGEQESYEEREVPSLLVKNPNKSFLLRVHGDSMEDAGIYDRSIILVESHCGTPSNGSIVIAAVNDQTVIKRYQRHKNKQVLLSENRKKAYPPICVSSEMSDHLVIHIFGVFKRVIPESMFRTLS